MTDPDCFSQEKNAITIGERCNSAHVSRRSVTVGSGIATCNVAVRRPSIRGGAASLTGGRMRRLSILSLALTISFPVAESATRPAFAEWRNGSKDEGKSLRDTGARASVPDAARQRLQERDGLKKETERFLAEGRIADAIAAAEKVLAIERAVWGQSHADVADSLRGLADLHADRDDFRSARACGQQALAMELKLHGERHWRTAEARRVLAHLDHWAGLVQEQRRALAEAHQSEQRAENLFRQGWYRQAFRPTRKALAIRSDVLGEDHPLTAAILNDLGVLHWAVRESQAARPYFEISLERRKKTLGLDHALTALSLNNLGAFLKELAEYDRAESLLRQARETFKRGDAEDHPTYALCLRHLASLYERREDYSAAREIRREGLALVLRLRGEEHWEVADAKRALAQVEQLAKMEAGQRRRVAEALQLGESAQWLHRHGKYREALEPVQRVLAIHQEVWGERSTQVAASSHWTGTLYYELKEYAQAEPFFIRAREIRRQLLGDQHPDYAATLDWLGALCHANGNYTAAASWRREALDILGRLLGESHPRTVGVYRNLARSLTERAQQEAKREDFASAWKTLQEVQAMYAKLEGFRHYRVTDASLALAHVERLERLERSQRQRLERASELMRQADALKNDGKRREAIVPTQQALDIREEVLGRDERGYANSLALLGWLYDRTGDRARALPRLRTALEIRQRLLGEEHPDTATSLRDLGECYRAQGEYVWAEPLLRRALEIRQKVLGDEHADTASALNYLANLHESKGDYKRAVQRYREAIDTEEELGRPKSGTCVYALEQLASLYDKLARMHLEREDFVAARDARREG